MAKTCPSVARSQLQSVYVMLEDTSGVLQPVAEDGFIVPVGRATMIQTPSYSDSEELSTSLNPIDQFQDAVPAGTGSISIYGRLDPNYGKPEGHALFEALMGDYNDPTKMTAKLSAAAPADAASITLKNIINGNDIDENILAGSFPPRGVIKIGTEKIRYASLTKGAGGSATISGLERGYAELKADFAYHKKFLDQKALAKFDRILNGDITRLEEKDIKSSGYVVDTLEAAIWAFLTTKNYREAVLKAVNLGEDTDTVGAVTGALAGLHYGLQDIPEEWLDKLAKREEIRDIAIKMLRWDLLPSA